MKTYLTFLGLMLFFPSFFVAQIVAPLAPNNERSKPVVTKEDEQELAPLSHGLSEPKPAVLNINEIKESIIYPATSKANAVEGKVVLRVLLDKNGNYADHIVLKNPDTDLTKAVTDQIHKLKYSPTAKNPAAIWVAIPFDFRLTEQELEDKPTE